MPDYQYTPPKSPNNKNSWVTPCLIVAVVLIGLGVLGIGGLVVGSLYFSSNIKQFQAGFDESFADAKLAAISAETNKTLPAKPADGVVLVETRTEPHRRFIYHYKMIDMALADVSPTFEHDVRGRLISSFKDNADIKTFLDLDATVVFEYHDKNDALISAIAINKDDLK